MIDAVVKIGGSLGRGRLLPPLCERLAALALNRRFVVVPGGGVFADAVRVQGARHRLGDAAQHWMAVLAMDAYGHLLADLIPGGACVSTVRGAEDRLATRRVPVLLCYQLLQAADPLPHSWAVTSDSIALWVGRVVHSHRVVLVKDGRGASKLGVDDYLPVLRAVSPCEVWIVNGERPAEVEAALDGDASLATRLQ